MTPQINLQKILKISCVALVIVGFCAIPRSSKADIGDIFDTAVQAVSSGFDYVWPDDVGVDDFDYKMGVGFGFTPDYVGSDNYRFRAVPLIDIRYQNYLSLQGTKLRLNIFGSDRWRVGPLINYKFGRSEGRNPALAGMGDIKDTIQIGGFAEVKLTTTLFSAEMRYALGANVGTELHLVLGQGLYQDDDWQVVAGIQAKFANAKYNQTKFGVSQLQATSTPYSAFRTRSGFNEVSLSMLATNYLTEEATVLWFINMSRIVGDAADSPLVLQEGSRNQGIVGVGFRYAF